MKTIVHVSVSFDLLVREEDVEKFRDGAAAMTAISQAKAPVSDLRVVRRYTMLEAHHVSGRLYRTDVGD
ncbi:MAG: hypothetical protein LPL29_14450 [Alphaproteobacteria bacterium]|nr:hypothetical protein [Alphaproteobacteria bacterium]